MSLIKPIKIHLSNFFDYLPDLKNKEGYIMKKKFFNMEVNRFGYNSET